MPRMLAALLRALSMVGCVSGPGMGPWQPLFPKDGIPQGWRVGTWNDVSRPADGNPIWRVENGVLVGGEPRDRKSVV